MKCAGCSTEILITGTKGKRKYCSDKCQRKYYTLTEKGWLIAIRNRVTRRNKVKTHMTLDEFEEWAYRAGYSSKYRAWSESGFSDELKVSLVKTKSGEDATLDNIVFRIGAAKIPKIKKYKRKPCKVIGVCPSLVRPKVDSSLTKKQSSYSWRKPFVTPKETNVKTLNKKLNQEKVAKAKRIRDKRIRLDVNNNNWDALA